MGISRRNALIGLGTVAAGAGAISVSGAFDSVEANRTFEVDVAGDAGGLLGLIAVNAAIAGTQEGGAGGNDVLFFSLNEEEVEETALNEDAVTNFFDVFVIANNGSQDGVEVSIDTGDAEGVTFTAPENPARNEENASNSSVLTADTDLSDGVELDVGESVTIDLSIDTTAEGGYVEPPEGEPYDMTITAVSPDAQ